MVLPRGKGEMEVARPALLGGRAPAQAPARDPPHNAQTVESRRKKNRPAVAGLLLERIPHHCLRKATKVDTSARVPDTVSGQKKHRPGRLMCPPAYYAMISAGNQEEMLR